MTAPALTALVLLASGTAPSTVLAASIPGGGSHAAVAAIPAADQASSDRDSYTAKAKSETSEWQRKITAEGREGSAKASRELDEAWTKTKTAAHQLETASAEGWDRAKAGFEKAQNNLAATWHRLHPEQK